jgi:hypothetical protein
MENQMRKTLLAIARRREWRRAAPMHPTQAFATTLPQVAAEITGTDECVMEAIRAGADGGTVSAKCIALLSEVDKAVDRKRRECLLSLRTKK